MYYFIKNFKLNCLLEEFIINKSNISYKIFNIKFLFKDTAIMQLECEGIFLKHSSHSSIVK
jgi:hypothetical protein